MSDFSDAESAESSAGVANSADAAKAGSSHAGGRRAGAHVLLVVLLAIEAVVLAGAALYFFFELLVDVPTSYASAIAIFVITAAAAVWLVVVTLAVWRGRSWSRGAAMFWQLVQLAIAVGSFQGVSARADIGWFLLVPAVLVIVLLFARSVMLATARRE